MLRSLLVTATLAATVHACGGTPDQVQQEARRRRLEAVGVSALEPTGSFGLVGVSALREIPVEPLRMEELGGDTLSSGYHLLVSRCAACHAVPSPSSKKGYEWEGVVSRMRRNAADAGLLPNTTADEKTLTAYLKAHASDAGPRRGGG